MTEPSAMTMGERIRELRTQRRFTLQQVGDFFGINRSSVSAWESGTSKPDSDKLPKLAAILGTTVEYLLMGEEKNLADVIKKTELSGLTYRNTAAHSGRPTTVRGTSYALPSIAKDVASLLAGVEDDSLRHALMDRLAHLRLRFDGRVPVLQWRDAGYWIVSDPDDKDEAMVRYENSPLFDPDRVAFRGIRTGGMLLLPKNVSPNLFGYSTLRNDVRENAIRCPFPCNPGTFALRIESDEFYDPDGALLTIREGDTIAVDPAQSIQEMDVVVIRNMRTGTATMRQYTRNHQGSQVLYAICPQRAQLDDINLDETPEIVIVGKVLGMWRPF